MKFLFHESRDIDCYMKLFLDEHGKHVMSIQKSWQTC